VWTNVVAACRRCNNLKASRTPEQAKMQLIAVPFTPTYAEYIFLKGPARARRPDGIPARALSAPLPAARPDQALPELKGTALAGRRLDAYFSLTRSQNRATTSS
jgi:hypothetical protein